MRDGEPANLEILMYGFPLKDPRVADRLARGLLLAGMPGQPSGYLKIYEENRLSGDEIRALMFGRTVTGFDELTGEQFWIDRTKEGKATIRSALGSDNGRSWVKGDILLDQWQIFMEGVKISGNVYRNPDARPEKKDEYIRINDFGPVLMSSVNGKEIDN